jgi:hypothetical protein
MFEFKTVLQYMNEGLLCSHDIENDGREGSQLVFDEISNNLCSKYRSHRDFTAYDGGEPVFGYIDID